ncbi:hypothetical protein [Psychrobacter aquimaris]|uniref:hypothetical protein n=1 Tax=Psychrobacter aquimaris TaxID=292733 RepID=UPI003FD52160
MFGRRLIDFEGLVELILLSACISLVDDVRTGLSDGVPVVPIPPPAIVRNAIVGVRIPLLSGLNLSPV